MILIPLIQKEKMHQKTIKTFPIFATPVGMVQLDDVDQTLIENRLASLEYVRTQTPLKNRCSMSKDLYILNKQELSQLKSVIMEKVKEFNTLIVGNEDCDFAMTTSWATKTAPGETSTSHNHKNSKYSAVYYNKIHSQMGGIFFSNYDCRDSFGIGIEHPTPYNADGWPVYPEDKTLIIFPSYLYHTIMENRGNQIRYSIACNFLPIGNFGAGDSRIQNLNLGGNNG